jgi:membrane fusion protein, type I secretion system
VFNILEIVPTDDDLIIEVRVRPQDIESVRRGQPATVRLSALNRRITPTLDGDVVYVSADAVPEDRPGQPGGDAYVARIRLDADQHAKVPEFVPTPGMPAEVYIKTHERTFLGYILKPLKDSLSRAFRES